MRCKSDRPLPCHVRVRQRLKRRSRAESLPKPLLRHASNRFQEAMISAAVHLDQFDHLASSSSHLS